MSAVPDASALAQQSGDGLSCTVRRIGPRIRRTGTSTPYFVPRTSTVCAAGRGGGLKAVDLDLLYSPLIK